MTRRNVGDESLRTELVSQVGTLDPIPSSFIEFAALVGLDLTPAQEVFGRVAYDGEDVSSLDERNRGIARSIFGDVDSVSAESRRMVVAVCGARAGKSLVIVACRLLHLALTVDVSGLGPGERGVALIVAPDLRLSRQALRYCQGLANQCQAIRSRIIEGVRGGTGVVDGFLLQREGDKQVAIECLPATRGGSAIRGRSYVAFALDEAAFFRDDNAVVNDEEVFRAAAARLIKGGQGIIASTAWEESGLLYRQFKENFGAPRTALACHAPTTLMRPDDETVAWVEQERRRDPDNAEREYDAVFMTGSGDAFFSPRMIDSAVDSGRTERMRMSKDGTASAGADFAFKRDSSALVIVERIGDCIHVDQPLEIRPTRETPLKPSDVCNDFAHHLRGTKIESIVTDGHYIESVREHLSEYNVSVVAASSSQDAKTQSYLALRDAFNEGLVRLPDNPRMVAQLKSIQRRPQPGGGMQIQAPRTGSGHGDLVSALVLAASKALGKRTRYHAARATRRWDDASSQDKRGVMTDTPDYSSDT